MIRSRMIVVPVGWLLLAGCDWGHGFILPDNTVQEPPKPLVSPLAPNHAAVDVTPGMPRSAFSPAFFNGVLLDSANNRAYVTNLQGGTDAVRLHDGLRCWSSAAELRPLAMCPEGVLCLCGGVSQACVVLLDAGSGSLIWESEPLGVPGNGLFCEVRWEQVELICSWRSASGQVGGGDHGVARIDFRTGQILARNSQPQFTVDGTAPQQPTHIANRAYVVAEDEDALRFLEAHDGITGKRLWRYPLLGRADAKPSAAACASPR